MVFSDHGPTLIESFAVVFRATEKTFAKWFAMSCREVTTPQFIRKASTGFDSFGFITGLTVLPKFLGDEVRLSA